MDKSKKIKMTQISPLIETQNLEKLAKKTQNTYESIAVIAKRANQIGADLKMELHGKLEDFASHTDTLEEIHENREQIEISKFYEKLPHPTILAMKEFQDDQISYRYTDQQ
ncbi:MAG: DNA-directed RNA polymerase subunit omega [Bacteroidetes bacterium]|nr:DNA-directed RNA polymerase subunit omega [Bacteroidota bacterium]MBS1618258.1 DNA-directed RNA polymerase subunit omega [Bacteroidota bacterium]